MKVCSSKEIQDTTVRGASVPRLRAQHEFHESFLDPIQRFLNAVEPGSYVRPHRHSGGNRWEWFQAVTGAAAILIFDGKGEVHERVEIRAAGPVYGLEIPPGAWHTLVSLAPGTVLLEFKPGPYAPLTDKDFAQWAPPEGHQSCPRFVTWYSAALVGDSPPAW
ncbi:MAG: WbuC family cupin fold metalloprotein [Candidatus Binatia bacterium]